MPFVKGQSGNIKGKPKGATSKPRLSNYLTEKQINDLVVKAYEMAATGNEAMLKLILEQKFGKPAQAVEVGGEGGGPIQMNIIQYGNNPTV